MKKIDYDLKKIELNEKAKLALSKNDVFLDIETTGLSPRNASIYLIGLGFVDRENSTIKVTQYFAETSSDEESMLQSFLEDYEPDDRIITFNGKMFDLPFLRDRIKKYNIKDKIDYENQFDLLQAYRPYRKLFSLGGMRQVMLQELLNLPREDVYNGGELIEVYQHLLQNHMEGLDDLLLHNRDDVEGLPSLLNLEEYLNLPERLASLKIMQDEGQKEVLFTGVLNTRLPSCIRYREDGFYLQLTDSRMKGILSLEEVSLRYYYPNPKDYVYLLMEQRIIPKILAESLPKDHYRKAKKDECYQDSKGQAIRVPDSIINYRKKNKTEFQMISSTLPHFYQGIEKEGEYIKFDEVTDQSLREFLRLYLLSLSPQNKNSSI